VDPGGDLLPDDLAKRLLSRVEELSPLGSLLADTVDVGPEGRAALGELAGRLADTYPFPDPHYAGQMLKPPHPVAWAAYAATMLLNPNNHALDGGPATASMEREAVAAMAEMFGFDTHLGHLAASGTIANLEALWVARELRPGTTILSGENAHYTHERMCGVLGVAHEKVAEDELGRMDLDALAARLHAGGVGTVVATLGTTGLGAVDDVDAIADLCGEHDVRLHVDAAYGGFFSLIADGGEPGVAAGPFGAVRRADSVVVDPHKHGLQPYGCGSVIFADPAVGRLYAHDSPYTYFTSSDLHLGEISLECSRSGASAAALWATLRALPLTRDGLGRHVAATRAAAGILAGRLAEDGRVETVVDPELDIVCSFARGASASDITASTERAFDALAREGWHLAKLRLDSEWLRRRHRWVEADAPTVTVLRSCLLKREHLDVAADLADATAAALTAR
jgi:glutamate/tyrosine decarboxylase-like PLP-dependent enzyme